MKKLMLILSAAVLMMAACSKSNNNNPKPALTPQNATMANVTGKWLATVDTTYIIDSNKTTVIFNGNADGLYFQFNADGTGIEGDSDDPSLLTFTYTVSVGTIVVHSPAAGSTPAQDSEIVIYGISSNTLVLTFYGTNTKQVISFTKQ